jgi:hypothetical protein
MQEKDLFTFILHSTNENENMSTCNALGLCKSEKKLVMIDFKSILKAIDWIIISNKLKIPYTKYQSKKSIPKTKIKKILTTQGKFFDKIISSIRFKIINRSLRIFFVDQNNIQKDITKLLIKSTRKTKNFGILKYPNAVDRITKLIRTFINKLATENQSIFPVFIKNIRQKDNVVCYYFDKNHSYQTLDINKSISFPLQKNDIKCIKKIIFERSNEREQLEQRREQLRKLLRSGKILTFPEIDLLKEWPTHTLIKCIRDQLSPKINEIVRKAKFLFDPQDLEHQILFRLTTFLPSKLFIKGSLLEGYFEQCGIYRDWQKIPKLSLKIISEFKLNPDIINYVIEEQLLILSDRMRKSKLSLNIIFKNIKIKEEDRYVLRWQKTEDNNRKSLIAVRINKNGKIIDSIPVDFRQIYQDNLTINFTRDLHYIHTDRASGDTFGLYFKDNDPPFAIESIESMKQSPVFRKDALLAKGFNPNYGIELTRLYTWPNSPRNIIGIMDHLVTNHYKSTSDIEVITTTVMPTYAKTRSTTIAGGINKVFYAKQLSHKFIRKNIDKKIVWEYITTRNLKKIKSVSNCNVIETHPKFPLYPTLGVYKQIKTKSFDEFPEIKGKIIGFDF